MPNIYFVNMLKMDVGCLAENGVHMPRHALHKTQHIWVEHLTFQCR